jgi:esterase/lipase
MQTSKGDAIKVVTPLLTTRHFPSGLNSRFIGNAVTFSEYIQHYRKLIAQVRAENGVPGLEKIIDGNAPFELRPADGFLPGIEKTYRRGILLTHGLSDSPYFMRHLAAFFQANGFLVMVVLLPGHGTQPGDLLDVSWQEWAATVDYGVDQLSREVDEIYLGGFSAGGALSLYKSMHDHRVRGLFLFAPALSVSPKAALASLHKVYSWFAPSAKWLNVHPDKDIYKYESFPKNAVAQMYALTRLIKKQLAKKEIQIPIFVAVSQDDATVNTDATIKLMQHARNVSNKLVYYYSDPVKIPAGFEKGKIEFVNSVISEKRISSSAHTAIVVPGEDEYYGEQGEYCNCLHYYPHDMVNYQACLNKIESALQGEVTDKNLKQGTLRRLMYNPHFSNLKSAMQEFIDKFPRE